MVFKDLGELFRQAREIGENLRNKQEELAKRRFEVSVGGGMVKMTFNGRAEALSIEIDREIVNPDEIDTLRDLVLSAVNQGVRESQRAMKEELGRLAGGLNIPGITS
jgi:DNA-binding YbaB/EbfC family protein